MRGTERLAGALEAYLFIHGSPVKRKELAAVMQEDDRRVQEALDVLAEKYGREDSGIQLHETGAGIALATKKNTMPGCRKRRGRNRPCLPRPWRRWRSS